MFHLALELLRFTQIRCQLRAGIPMRREVALVDFFPHVRAEFRRGRVHIGDAVLRLLAILEQTKDDAPHGHLVLPLRVRAFARACSCSIDIVAIQNPISSALCPSVVRQLHNQRLEAFIGFIPFGFQRSTIGRRHRHSRL